MKRFKEFDKEFKSYEGKFFNYEGLDWNSVHLRTQNVKQWMYKVFSWTRVQIEDAVYTSETAREWQKFRVSLKGCSTQLKLLRLEIRYQCAAHGELSVEERRREYCRIDNYIGALVRGGQLRRSLEIAR